MGFIKKPVIFPPEKQQKNIKKTLATSAHDPTKCFLFRFSKTCFLKKWFFE